MNIVLAEFVDEQRTFWRNPAAAIFTSLFPIVCLVVFATLFGNMRVRDSAGNPVDMGDYFVPGILAFSVAASCFFNLSGTVALRRELGVMKRWRATPVRLGVLIAAQVASGVVVAVGTGAAVVAIGVGALHAQGPTNLWLLVGGMVVGCAALSACAIAITSVLPSGDTAQTVLTGIFYPLALASGLFYPIPDDSWLFVVGNVFPIGPFMRVTFAAFDPLGTSGTPIDDLAVISAWGVASFLIAHRTFRWMPRQRR